VTERVIMAGWGGQGMMMLGKLVAWIMMQQGKHVSYFPCYGAEVRGGSAHCHLVFSDEPIHSPVVEHADTIILMSQPAYTRFRGRLKPDGLLLSNATLVEGAQAEHAQRLISAPASAVADDLGDTRVANMVMLGVYNAVKRFAPDEAALAGIEKAFAGAKPAVRHINIEAYGRGMALAMELMGKG